MMFSLAERPAICQVDLFGAWRGCLRFCFVFVCPSPSGRLSLEREGARLPNCNTNTTDHRRSGANSGKPRGPAGSQRGSSYRALIHLQGPQAPDELSTGGVEAVDSAGWSRNTLRRISQSTWLLSSPSLAIPPLAGFFPSLSPVSPHALWVCPVSRLPTGR